MSRALVRRQRKRNTVWHHLCVGSKKRSQTDRKREWNGVCERLGEMGRCWSKGTYFQLKDSKF